MVVNSFSYRFYFFVWLLYGAALIYPDIERVIYQNELMSLLGLTCALKYFVSNRNSMTKIEVVYLLFLLYGLAVLIVSIGDILDTGWYLSLRTMPIFYNSLSFMVGIYMYNCYLRYRSVGERNVFSLFFLALTLLTPWRLSPQVFAMFFISSYKYALGYLALFFAINGGSTSITAFLLIAVFLAFENKAVIARFMSTKLIVMYLVFFLMMLYFSSALYESFLSDGYEGIFSFDVNLTWRYMFWVYLFQEVISNNPIFGIGFGVPLFDLDVIPDFITSDDGSRNTGHTLGTHNSIIYLLTRMGLIGVILIGAIHVMIYRCAFDLYKNKKSPEVISLILVNLMFLNSMFFNVVLESPLYGGGYWASLGILYGAIRFKSINDEY